MSTWQWVLVGLVVWVSLVYVGGRIWLIRTALRAQKQAMTEITHWPTFEEGPPLPGDAFGPLHRKQP